MTRTPLSRTSALAAALTGAAALLATAGTASAAPVPPSVFVLDDAVSGNAVHAYSRQADGTLASVGTYATGGLGGQLAGSVVDHTASQGALAADRAHQELLAVNPGSDTLSVLRVHNHSLSLREVVATGGAFPVSVTSSGDAVYVLNARDGGSISGFRWVGNRLVAVPAWHRELHLPVPAAEFVSTPGQVAVTPDGTHLVVTTKASTASILVYGLDASGAPAAAPVATQVPGTVPFAVASDAAGHLAVAFAGTSEVRTYAVAADGTLTTLGQVATGQAATCWIAASGDLLVASNAGSGTVSRIQVGAGGGLTALGTTATDPGTVDSAFTPDGSELFVQTGATGTVDAYAVDGTTLTPLGSTVVPGAVGGEGIVAW
ncbi:6-phosphogluconolactonase (cycloisomerase 2 family) [Motilibacter rhizosphaerae]|uniref:6-phosphogluconolactonase (Cycloisomerase 2 family) n=1 Tax=Motilibacter rhizosphaerae TaxID=598652 RepID=A0A4Q7NAA6_9ACTN|nr:hypothetical protein [Motilibacter rhizosphaerae]RZS79404.1 6-phosphogluconolactonase (cycloisomerase 2 family) [Motilibacter rhizosphaerae]